MGTSRRSYARLPVLGFALTSLLARGALGDARVWEKDPEDEKLNRYVDLTAYIQPGFIWHQDDPDPAQPNPNQADYFEVQRARIGFKSRIHQYAWLRLEYDAQSSALADTYIEGRFLEPLRLRFGRFQIPFLRTFLFGEQGLAFNDRTLYTPQQGDRRALRYLSPRDTGVMVAGRVPIVPGVDGYPVIEYSLGMFLGQAATGSNIDDAYLYAGRLQVHATGIPDGFENESDLARNQIPRISAAGGVYTNCDDRFQWNRGWTADAEFRYQGIYASATFVRFKNGKAGGGLAEGLGYTDKCKGQVQSDGSPQPDHIATGMSAQLQYVLPQILTGDEHAVELLTRVDQVNPQSPCNGITGKCSFFGGGTNTPSYNPPATLDNEDNPPTRYRLTLGVNWFPDSRQNFRLSLNYLINREAEDIITANGRFKAVKNDAVWFQVTAGI